ncbi:uncharacterized protein UV8b_01649 [Ustilaginoidea virens]|uniref:STAS domain-containing protein n=1 Tax=Ustilaginoidea virens TaxID=1159556 RepID=A0A8E5HLB4_USTVR|nr:uncharacterized protein UV8b_01649 [Ustilaginoidea virens]QUC17408.1 hypothetical protein UV8b_01649 [Ustilaginoidea virens]
MAQKPKLSQVKQRALEALRNDANWNRVARCIGRASRRLPSATADYLAEKLPVAQWLPHYDYRWIVRDAIGGITVGAMLIPQALAYAKIATISIENGLYSSFFPPALYFFLGTSKELSPGPTSILGLLTAEIVADLANEGHQPNHVASAVAFVVGIYALGIGLLKLGFLIDFVSSPVLTGWISAVAIVISLGQLDSLLGLDSPSGAGDIVRETLRHLDRVKPLTLCIGATSIALLCALQHAGRRWGSNSRPCVKFLGTSRAVVALVVFTLVSYLCNRNRGGDDFLWAVSRVDAHGLPRPKGHEGALLKKVVSRSFAPLVAMSVEHLGAGKAFGLRNGYNVDTSQELVFLGASNMVNSLFGAMPTGGGMSRTAVGSDCNVHSPVNSLFTSGFVILTLYQLAPALYWIPKATLSAIIITAVSHLVASPSQFYRFWKMSLIDFVGSMLGLWVTLFTSTEAGLATAVGFTIVYTLVRLAFPRWTDAPTTEPSDAGRSDVSAPSSVDVPPEAYLVQYTQDILFANAERLKASIIQSVKMHFDPPRDTVLRADNKSTARAWNPSGEKRILKMRKRKGITPISGDRAPLRRVVLDLTRVSFVDCTGIMSLDEMKMEVRRYMGPEVAFRFVGMADEVRERFRRSEWEIVLPGQKRGKNDDVLYSSLRAALLDEASDEDEPAREKDVEAASA